MTRFYFNIYNDEVTLDEEGIELADLDAARDRAVAETRILACESIRNFGHLVMDHRIEITDGEGAKLTTVRFGDAIEIRR